jgi:hypothetical protein
MEKVITVERSEVMFEIAKSTIGKLKNVVMLRGDTRDHLPSVLELNDNILFWLDAHWSEGDTYGEADECPLLHELKIIFGGGKTCAILVDDARLFLAPPPKPHVMAEWPTIKDIVDVLPSDWDMLVHEDVIYLLPIAIGLEFRAFVQADITEKWLASSDSSLTGKILGAPSFVLRILRARLGR